MQLAERADHATPVGPRLGRSALQVGHHHQTIGEQPAVHGRGAYDIAAQASAAWEAAVCWGDEYAIKRLAEVRAVIKAGGA